MIKHIFWVLALLAAPMAHAQSQEEIAEARLQFLAGNYEPALKVLRPAAEAGDANAQNLLGIAYTEGDGVPLDVAVGVKWLEKSAAQNFDKALFNLGLHYRDGTASTAVDYPLAITYFERAMKLEYAHAFNMRGLMHQNGEGGEVDKEAARDLFQRAADMDLPLAMNNLGKLYLPGRGPTEDMFEAFWLFYDAAEMGDPEGMNNLGAMFQNGYATAPNQLAAFGLFYRAATRGNTQSAFNLAEMLISYNWDLHDPVEGWAWCLIAQERASRRDADRFESSCKDWASDVSAADKAAGAAMAKHLRQNGPFR